VNGIENTRLLKLEKFQNEILMLLNGSLSSSRIISYLLDSDSKPICHKSTSFQHAMHQEYINTYYKSDPLYPANFRDTNEGIVKMSDLVPLHNRSKSDYVRNFILPWNINDNIEMFFRVDGKLVAGISILLQNQKKDLTTNDLTHLHRYIEFTLAQILVTAEKNDYDSFCDTHGLTAKERMVAQLAIQGLANKSIANELHCSVATVKTHLQNIFAKLAVNSKVEMTSLLYRSNCLM